MHENYAEDSGHPDSQIVAAYVENNLDPSARRAFKLHLAVCASCRNDLVEVAAFYAQDTWYRRLGDWCRGRWKLLRMKLARWV